MSEARAPFEITYQSGSSRYSFLVSPLSQKGKENSDFLIQIEGEAVGILSKNSVNAWFWKEGGLSVPASFGIDNQMSIADELGELIERNFH
ncbi:hypothetical protein [Arcticibacter sp. MXS-1]|uniref:hypothetical protein n=1 Tax=Arcticibacter sp. MXS-1 TaxID=3341726 RepID=UPI0035A882D2